jgi:hypothetical protein
MCSVCCQPSVSYQAGVLGQPPDAAVISHALWVQAFAGAPDVLGRALRLGTQTFTIVGAAPKGFTGIDFDPTDVWLPIDMRGPLRFSVGASSAGTSLRTS